MSCKGICVNFKINKKYGASWYRLGYKRCQGCEIFIIHPGLYCPCCGIRLRTKPRHRIYKAKLRESLLT